LRLLEIYAGDSQKSYQQMNDALVSFEVVYDEVEDEFREVESELTRTSRTIEELERKLLRVQLRKQGKELLPCEYKSQGVLGCFGDYPCQNCRTNYLEPQTG
jgi:chromosome segregation ATPase